MTDPVQIAWIVAGAGIMPTLVGLVNAWLLRQAEARGKRNEAHLSELKSDTKALAKNTDGLKDALVAATEKAALQIGMELGVKAVASQFLPTAPVPHEDK